MKLALQMSTHHNLIFDFQKYLINQTYTWKLSGGTTLEKYSNLDLSDNSKEVEA